MIEKYDQDLMKYIEFMEKRAVENTELEELWMRAMIAKHWFDPKEIEEQFEKAESAAPNGFGVHCPPGWYKKLISEAEQALEFVKDFTFRAELFLSDPLFGYELRIYTQDDQFALDVSALTKEEKKELQVHLRETIEKGVGARSWFPVGMGPLYYPSRGLMEFLAKLKKSNRLIPLSEEEKP